MTRNWHIYRELLSCYRDYFNLPQTAPKVSLPLPDLGNQIEEDAARIEREIQLLRTEPTAFKERDVYMRWIQDGQDLGVHHGTVHDVDDDADTDGPPGCDMETLKNI